MTKRNALILALILGLSSITSYAMEIDAAHSTVGFEVKHMMIANVGGNFNEYSATITGDGKDLTKSSVDFKVKTASISTYNAKRDEHLKDSDFFDVEKFPEASFKSTKVTKVASNKYKINGDLTIKGVTKPATFELLDLGRQKDPMGNMKRGFQAVSTINRKDFGLTWNKALDNGGVAVSDKVKVKLDIEAKE